MFAPQSDLYRQLYGIQQQPQQQQNYVAIAPDPMQAFNRIPVHLVPGVGGQVVMTAPHPLSDQHAQQQDQRMMPQQPPKMPTQPVAPRAARHSRQAPHNGYPAQPEPTPPPQALPSHLAPQLLPMPSRQHMPQPRAAYGFSRPTADEDGSVESDEDGGDADADADGADEDGAPSRRPMSASKLERRRARERESARRSRRRKKEQLENLDGTVKALMAENNELRRRAAHKDLLVLREAQSKQMRLLEQLAAAPAPDDDGLRKTMEGVKANDRTQRAAVRTLLHDLAQILEPTYKTEAMLWILEGIGNYEPTDDCEGSGGSSVGYGSVSGPASSHGGPGGGPSAGGAFRGLLCENSRAQSQLSSAPTSGRSSPVQTPGSFRDSLAPISASEVSSASHDIVRRVIRAMGIDRLQHMQIHLWLRTHKDSIAHSRSLHLELKQITYRLQQLRADYDAGWRDMAEALRTIEGATSPLQDARFAIFAEQYSAAISRVIGLQAPAPATEQQGPPHAGGPVAPGPPPKRARLEEAPPKPASPGPAEAVRPMGRAHPPPPPPPPEMPRAGAGGVPSISEALAELGDVI